MKEFRFTKSGGSELLYYGDEFVGKFSQKYVKLMEEVFQDARGLKEVQLQLRLSEQHAATMAKDFDASVEVLRAEIERHRRK